MNIQEKLVVRTEAEQSQVQFIDLKAQQAVVKDQIDRVPEPRSHETYFDLRTARRAARENIRERRSNAPRALNK